MEVTKVNYVPSHEMSLDNDLAVFYPLPVQREVISKFPEEGIYLWELGQEACYVTHGDEGGMQAYPFVQWEAIGWPTGLWVCVASWGAAPAVVFLQGETAKVASVEWGWQANHVSDLLDLLKTAQ